MAQKVFTQLLDDIDGGEAEETVTFALDGTTYEIDLSQAHAAEVREALSPYVDAARKMKAERKATAKAGKPAASKTVSRERTQAIRVWAKASGKDINERGRIPQAIVDEYEKAQRLQGVKDEAPAPVQFQSAEPAAEGVEEAPEELKNLIGFGGKSSSK